MLTDHGLNLTVLAMALTVFLTRIGGVLLMAHVDVTPRIDRFLQGTSVAVIAGLVAPSIAAGTGVERIAVAIAAVTAVIGRGVAIGMGAGVVCFFLLRIVLA